MAGSKKQVQEAEIEILELKRGEVRVFVLGVTPLICNRMSEKAKRELLYPSPKKNAAARASSLKHIPLDEYRASIHRLRDEKAATLVALPAVSFKGALRSATLDMPGAAKTQIGRLTYIKGEYVPIYGIPQLLMSVTRMADKNRTPDIRTRAILPEWCCEVTIVFQTPILNQKQVANLFAAAGMNIGVGDFRPEKGAGNYGQFELVSADHPDVVRMMRDGARKLQLAAMEDPAYYDIETEEMMEWYDAERSRRGMKAV